MNTDYFATFIVPTYNQAAYIRESLLSVFNQNCAASEILVADDCSDDRTFEIIKGVAKENHSHHKVTLSRNRRNLGSGNIMALAERASAKHIVAFHGDDVSHPERASRLIATMTQQGASMVSSNTRLIDAAGRPYATLTDCDASGFLELSQLVHKFDPKQTGATLAFEKAVIDEFLPWTQDTYWFAGDHVLPFRAALLGGCYYLDETLLDRRQHQTNQGKEVKVSLNTNLTPAMRKEIKIAHYLAVRSFMLRDTRTYALRNGDTAKTQQAVTALNEGLMTHLAEWSKIRTELLNSGQRPTWIDRQQFTAAINASAVIKGKSMKPAILRNLGRTLKRLFGSTGR